jgi:hypothetical protein
MRGNRNSTQPQGSDKAADAAPTKPSALQYIGYSYGKKLPDSMQDWVRNDLAGPGAARRMVLRWTVPCVLLLLPMWFIPASLYVHAEMTLPILIPFVYFAIALNKVWRRHQLQLHHLDPDLVDERARERLADERRAYEERYRTSG